MFNQLRPPAVPLVTIDPYFNVWSMADYLYSDYTKHWTGKNHGMTGIIEIDGNPYVFMGRVEEAECPILEQTNLEVKPLVTIYTFEGNGVKLQVEFASPLFMDDLEVLSRPVSYVTFSAVSVDGKQHDIKIYFDASAEWCVNNLDQKVIWKRRKINNINTMCFGNETQNVLNEAGDDIRIDWGYFYLVLPDNGSISTVIKSSVVREEFINTGAISNIDDSRMPRAVEDELPVMAAVIDMGKVQEETSAFLLLAYDDIYSIEYFEKQLPSYWRRNGMSFDEMLTAAVNEYPEIMKKCEEFNEKLIEDGKKAGGEKYALMLSLAYRQAIAAHKLVADEEGEVLFFSKECFSNGCMGTVDVSYPSIPLFLIYNTELVKGMMRPIFKYAETKEWTFDFAPHDVGRYPKANGQVYGKNREDGTLKLDKQMPVEECGNMLIMMAAVSLIDKDTSFVNENWELLTKWADYLLDFGLDPGNQLCTDDFAGHLAHNTNLSIKAILGIAGYSLLCKMLGKEKLAEKYIEAAKTMANQWEAMAYDGDHYSLTFNTPRTWSQKYNLVWDKLFKLNVFNEKIIENEIKYYINVQNQYGLPLDSRKAYTKTDWLLWTATMAESQEDFEKFINPIWEFLNDTPCRVPFTDWYETITGMQTDCMCHSQRRGFRNRTVIGGIFIKLLKEKNLF